MDNIVKSGENVLIIVHKNIAVGTCVGRHNSEPVNLYISMFLVICSILNLQVTLSGNDVIHTLTKGRISTLYVTIQMADDAEVLYQIYGQFSVSDEDRNYKLYLADPGNGSLGKFLYS